MQAAALLEGGQERLQDFVESLEYEPATYAAAKQRLQSLNALLQDCGCGSTAELLAVADETRAALAHWAAVAGALQYCLPSLPRCREKQRGVLCFALPVPPWCSSCGGPSDAASTPLPATGDRTPGLESGRVL